MDTDESPSRIRTRGTSPLWLNTNEAVQAEWVRLEREQITPWAFLNSGHPLRVKDFYGKQIAYEGIGFEGSPRLIFWRNYIEPYLKDLAQRMLRCTAEQCKDRGVDFAWAGPQTAGLVKAVNTRAFNRMAEIDRRLMGRGHPESVRRMNIDSKLADANQFVDQLLKSELAMWKASASSASARADTPSSPAKIFYSWQSDTPARIGRAFIRAALEGAIADLDIDRASRPEVDQDTQGVLGSPVIADTVFAKIRSARIVVADVTLTGTTPEGKGVTNSNVAVELGYALGTSGDEVLLKIMNDYYGGPEQLPFDLAHRRWPTRFTLAPDASKKECEIQLKSLTSKLRGIFAAYARAGIITS